MTRYAFRLDASACSGCKACQVACKDKHDLPVGVLWRRVYEVTGGGWQRRGGAWLNDVFAYNVSMACNHCERPICLEVCPTGAIGRRDDGIVLIDADRCMGCRYCEWACPYGALQYHTGIGQMTKCTFCVDELDAGHSPACVAACPLRVLEVEAVEAVEAVDPTAGRDSASATPVFPMPDPGLTAPEFRVTPHPRAPTGNGRSPARAVGSDVASSATGVRSRRGRTRSGPRVANGEEVAMSPPGLREPSLVAFTLSAQTAVGMLWAVLAARWLGPGDGALAAGGAGPAALTAIAILSLVAVAISFLHLGRPRNARRALSNLRSSWLSREILFMAMFTAGSVALLGFEAQGIGSRDGVSWPADLVAAGMAAVGLALVYSMARVYRLRTVPAWDTVRTTVGFFGTALVLGALALVWVQQLAVIAGAALVVATVAAVRARTWFYASHDRVGV